MPIQVETLSLLNAVQALALGLMLWAGTHGDNGPALAAIRLRALALGIEAAGYGLLALQAFIPPAALLMGGIPVRNGRACLHLQHVALFGELGIVHRFTGLCFASIHGAFPTASGDPAPGDRMCGFILRVQGKCSTDESSDGQT